MLNRIIHFSINNKLIIAGGTIALIIWGIWSATKLPIDAVPDITNNQVQIITVSPTLATQEVEQFITYPIEQSMSNLPDLEEMRSISRFGLSVITVVFDDKVDIYFARQLVIEKLREAEENIPKGLGKPELAPVSTGLGEIYQYIIHPKEGSEDKYSPMDLRTMQDWIVARQLYGTPGIAEVNGFGGFLKQYEVAVNPQRLKAMDVTIPEIFSVLEKNNQNTGGAYIEKGPSSYYIRAIGLVNSLEDIGNIAIKKDRTGIPILIRDVAEVGIGSAIRYGALTYNGEKEAVGGIVMMLKGANSAEVVANVKKKIEEIQKSLPEDVVIEPYLDRTELVSRAIRTVETNLLEGALIVIFVLILFLGNIRPGLIVASIIPLSMLFALGMMNLFGVSANLMSLGAIDFGLIVDGAVIIVEATLHLLVAQNIAGRLTQAQMDNVVEKSAEKMMNSAAFGQLIILIVYLPILSLRGIEGKMFTPMAQTVSFAILGALILSLTYVPMMSAVFISKNVTLKKTLADRIMEFFQRVYRPLIHWSIKRRYPVVGGAVILLVISGFLFSRMGGEFIPQLKEGDYAFHCILPQGSSLSQSVETSMMAERIIKSFPEVKTVVGKTGSAEIATDPMPPEATDLIITLKPMKEWTTTKDYNELAHLMMKKLEVIPGVFFEANQPIQMRFNELMTGVRQDVAIKIFGENIDTLAALAPMIANVVQTVKGVSDPQIERTTGLPQITVEYDRERMAYYNLNVDDVNKTISTAFAGESAGAVFENERRFDLTVRLDSASRNSIEDVSNLYIPTQDGFQIPLAQVATITVKEGPAQISRDDGKRRIVVGFNVEGGDVESVVNEIQDKLSSPQYKLPVGYYVTYGGTFQNLKEASARLSLAVPAAFLLIFVLLYFTFHSFKEAVLIYTAIPMSAIGGVFALLARGLPFSISAGVGFIALFGVAVLNGIVLISTFNQLEKEGMQNVFQRVLEGTKMRLRPVLMTATVASLGFLPMAINTGTGAEVQRPLATVVIGGLVTATFLTLVVLPCLYIIFSGKRKKGIGKMALTLLIPLIFLGQGLKAQQRISVKSAIDSALKYNMQIDVNRAEIGRATYSAGTANEIPKTEVFIENEDFRPSDPQGVLKIGLGQSINYPGLYKARKQYLNEQLRYYELNTTALQAAIKRDVNTVYYQLWYLQDNLQLYQQLDSIYTSLFNAASLRFKTGDVAGLDKISAEARMKEIQAIMQQNISEMQSQQQQLMLLLNTDATLLPVSKPLEKLELEVAKDHAEHPLITLQQQNINIADANITVQKNMNKPDFSGRVFSQRLWGAPDPFTGFSFSVGVPLFAGSYYKNKIRAAGAERDVEKKKLDLATRQFSIEQKKALTEIEKTLGMLNYYEKTGLKQADEIIKTASVSYNAGEISFAELSQFISQAIETKRNYLEVLNNYNQAVILYNYYNNK